jgi:O-antigen/teichoic acid export membrane protein
LFAAGEGEPLRTAYRRSCRLNALITVPTVCCLALFSRPALLIWTRSPEIADRAHLFLSLLVIGYGLNQLALMPFALQVASGWIQLGVFTNAAAVVVIVPALVLATRFYGGVGAAAVWILLNCIYLFIYVNILHARILKGEAKPWYGGILVPSLIALGIGIPGRLLLASVAGGRLVLAVGFLWMVAVVATIFATPDLRRVFPRWLNGPGKSPESGGDHA